MGKHLALGRGKDALLARGLDKLALVQHAHGAEQPLSSPARHAAPSKEGRSE